MIINIISRFATSPGSILTWWLEISQSDATIVSNNPNAVFLLTNNGNFNINNDIYPNSGSTINWVLQEYNGLWYIVLGLMQFGGSTFFTDHTINDIISANAIVIVPSYGNLEIITQPDQDSKLAAYKPIYFQINATIVNPTLINNTPAVVYCDIYLNDIYYKTISKNHYLQKNSIGGLYEFDIQDVLQEVLTYNLPILDGNQPLKFNNTNRKVFVKFRNAKYDTNGFIISEQPEPIQATSSNIAIAGLGLVSNTFYVYNATIQHEDNQSLESLLGNYRSVVFNNFYLPLTRKPQYFYLGINDSSYFPIISKVSINRLSIVCKLKNSTNTISESLIIPLIVKSSDVYYLPEGVPNIAPKFPNIDFNNVSEYFLIYENTDFSEPIAGSRRIKINSCKNNKKCRIHFINGFGETDSINFERPETNEEIKSDSWTKARNSIFNRTQGGSYRQNITSNEIVEAECNEYTENDQFWIKELFETPLAWVEMQMPQGFNSSFTKEYVPIEILDSKFTLRKNEKRYDYVVKIKFSMSNANINLR